ncbi:hypothetical protein Daura_19110 [Dactylosporangium aurantiacum]|uniref:Lipoprotein n=1 Tax=Dactylosporangium aurantiacum TaxID=35754 RepID=A0A9Q9ILX5_9ACTN|nr:hypothetical protein [Dactylosporangium aurantiacum]MDG6109916.1 hypothetical protein [Dactylosporangium aurantiacum]UWZ58086.1 hypothetical protein Daura_19110 [Dactylosporangium aurantiacum]
MSGNVAVTAVRRISLAAVLALGACRGPQVAPQPAPTPVSSPTVAPIAAPVPFRLQLGAGHRLVTRSPAPSGCPGLDTVAVLGSGGAVRFLAYATTCATDGNDRLINGRHGVYRTAEDVPRERRAGAATVQTALGEAIVFMQPYSEYTNSSNHYTEPVSVITLRQPADPAYRTVVVLSEKGTLSLEQLTTLVREQLLAP